jgi:NAD(P)-dependent dehydrogenase (short-subunit alcohol dehydrogenase family)
MTSSAIAYRLAGKRALVTGAASGIGLATVELFARAGASVALNDLPGERLEAQVARLRVDGLKVIAAPGDVGRPGTAAAFTARAISELGGLDCLVNNAGAALTKSPIPPDDLDALTEAFWTRILAVNLTGAFWVAKAAVPALRASGGSVVNTVSSSAFGGGASSTAYATAKTGLLGLTRELARGLAPEIRVNGIAPGFVNSNWECSFGDIDRQAREATLLKRVGQPEDYAAAILFLAVDAAYVTGQVLQVDGGLRL